MIPFNGKLVDNGFESILVFEKWFLLGFTATVALFVLFDFLYILVDSEK